VQARARVLRLEDFRGLIKEEVYWSREQRFNEFRGSKNSGQQHSQQAAQKLVAHTRRDPGG